MNVSATFSDTGEFVNIVDMDCNGCEVYITYVTSAADLKVRRAYRNSKSDYTTLGTGATVN